MLNSKEFEVIREVYKQDQLISATEIFNNTYHECFESVDEIKEIVSKLQIKGYLSENGLTDYAIAEIEPLKVTSAIILAAGHNEISPKSIYSMPKGLFMKNGETLIERQIRQLKEVGIDDITVVIGYKQELYFFLKDKWNVKLEINPDKHKNNVYSLYVAKKHLKSTYICNSDNYFEENPFSLYEYRSYHSLVFKRNTSHELSVTLNNLGRITSVFNENIPSLCLFGHAFVNQEFSTLLINFLENEIDNFRVTNLFWEEFVSKHIEDLDIYSRIYKSGFISEFDAVQEIQNINGLFLGNVSKKINDKICEVLKCKTEDISNVNILQKGLTNILFTFHLFDEVYIFRYPCDSSEFFIYRKNECIAQNIAYKSKADETFVYIDEQGIKISKYRQHCIDLHPLYYKDETLMCRIAKKISQFHKMALQNPSIKECKYDPMYECKRLFSEASKQKGDLFKIFKSEWDLIETLKKYADMDDVKHTMCHNDINIDNILVTDNSLDIIDWEFAGYNDPAYDFGRVIAGYEIEPDSPIVIKILTAYFGRLPTEEEHLHWIAYSAIHNWYYVGWALYKESISESSRDWMLYFYNQSKMLAHWALPKYIQKYGMLE